MENLKIVAPIVEDVKENVGYKIPWYIQCSFVVGFRQ